MEKQVTSTPPIPGMGGSGYRYLHNGLAVNREPAINVDMVNNLGYVFFFCISSRRPNFPNRYFLDNGKLHWYYHMVYVQNQFYWL